MSQKPFNLELSDLESDAASWQERAAEYYTLARDVNNMRAVWQHTAARCSRVARALLWAAIEEKASERFGASVSKG